MSVGKGPTVYKKQELFNGILLPSQRLLGPGEKDKRNILCRILVPV